MLDTEIDPSAKWRRPREDWKLGIEFVYIESRKDRFPPFFFLLIVENAA